MQAMHHAQQKVMAEYNDEAMQRAYLKGYREGFIAALKVAWAYGEELLISAPNNAKELVQEYIDKLKS